jgi:hypothetical protein
MAGKRHGMWELTLIFIGTAVRTRIVAAWFKLQNKIFPTYVRYQLVAMNYALRTFVILCSLSYEFLHLTLAFLLSLFAALGGWLRIEVLSTDIIVDVIDEDE